MVDGEKKTEQVVLPGQTPEGEYILGVLVKRTYDIFSGKKCIRAEKDRKLISGDVHYDGPMNSSVQFETDFLPYKLATDFVVNCSAYAPGGKPVQKLTA